jgi:gas vesicle protein
MASDDRAGAGSILLAFILGAVSGAAVALLYAPTSGRETRELLGERAREGRETAGEAAKKGRQVIAQGRETLTTAIEQGRETLTTAIERGREAYQQARTRETV